MCIAAFATNLNNIISVCIGSIIHFTKGWARDIFCNLRFNYFSISHISRHCKLQFLHFGKQHVAQYKIKRIHHCNEISGKCSNYSNRA